MSKFFEDDLKKAIEKYQKQGVTKATMRGVYADLAKLKPVIEKIQEEYIYLLCYYESDAIFCGWADRQDEMKNMSFITHEIQNKFTEIYALILLGLGLEETIPEKEYLVNSTKLSNNITRCILEKLMDMQNENGQSITGKEKEE